MNELLSKCCDVEVVAIIPNTFNPETNKWEPDVVNFGVSFECAVCSEDIPAEDIPSKYKIGMCLL